MNCNRTFVGESAAANGCEKEKAPLSGRTPKRFARPTKIYFYNFVVLMSLVVARIESVATVQFVDVFELEGSR